MKDERYETWWEQETVNLGWTVSLMSSHDYRILRAKDDITLC